MNATENVPASSTDVAVVGGGIVGLSIAWHIASRSDRQVTIVEGIGIGSGQTSIQPGGVRRQWSSRINCDLASYAYPFYMELSDQLGFDIDAGFKRCGYVFLAHSDQRLRQLTANIELQREYGVDVQLLSAEEVSQFVPGLTSRTVVGASYCQDDGYFDRPSAVVDGLLRACTQLGVKVVDGWVTSIDRSSHGWSLRTRDRRSLDSEVVVLANGCESAPLVSHVGVQLPVAPVARYLFYSNPIHQRILEPLVVSEEKKFAAKQLGDGSVLASDLSAGSIESEGELEWRRHLDERIEELLPILSHVSFRTLVRGEYDMTPDGLPVVSRVLPDADLWVAVGNSGRGFMMAPAIGDLVSKAVLEGSQAELMRDLSIERFGRRATVTEGEIV
ncbi:MAG: FAD-binding oxidoreductase [Actinomycetota bacterium]|nr:FAD-binding oxidoreductase [Actinomycetota bacterium]